MFVGYALGVLFADGRRVDVLLPLLLGRSLMYGMNPFPDVWAVGLFDAATPNISSGGADSSPAVATLPSSAAVAASANTGVDAGGFTPLVLTRQQRFATLAPSALALGINHGQLTGVPNGPLPPGRAKKLIKLDPPAKQSSRLLPLPRFLPPPRRRLPPPRRRLPPPRHA